MTTQTPFSRQNPLAEEPRSMMLPPETADHSPSVTSEAVMGRSEYRLFLVLTVAQLAATAIFLRHWFTHGSWATLLVETIALTMLLGIELAMFYGRWFLLPQMRRPQAAPAAGNWRVAAATAFVPGAESLDMLEETVAALIALDYPHDTWVLDEGNDPCVKALCDRLGALHFSRAGRPEYQRENGHFQSATKHGNYNAWLDAVGFDRYDFLSAFDVDHIPVRQFLGHVLGYFCDLRVGYVQMAQAYYNQSAGFIARGAAEEMYDYVSCVQMASYGMGYCIVNGSHNTHRVGALRQVGGFAPHDADDLLITLLYRNGGWKGVYVPQVLARGMTPVDWPGYLGQQRRWARSVVDLKCRTHSWGQPGLAFRARAASFLHGVAYVRGGATVPAGLAVLVWMLGSGRIPGMLHVEIVPSLMVLCLTLLVGERYRKRFYLEPRQQRAVRWRAALLRYAKWPWLLAAIRDVLKGMRPGYAVTRKAGKSQGGKYLLWPHALTGAAVLTAWSAGVTLGHPIPVTLHLAAALTVGLSVALFLTQFLTFPDQYDRKLFSSDCLRHQDDRPDRPGSNPL